MKPKPKPTKRKRTERQELDDECMEYIKHIVRLRDKGCVTPGNCYGYLTASHWQPRACKKTRYDLQNINCQCSSHNIRHNHFQAPYNLYMIKHYGCDICRTISQEASVTGWKWSIDELRQIRDGLKAEYERLNNESNLHSG